MKQFSMKLIATMATTMFAVSAFAQEAAAPVAQEAGMGRGIIALAAAIAISISVLGGTLAQGKTATAALEGIARNPAASGKLLIPMILGLALIESLVIYALIIALRLA